MKFMKTLPLIALGFGLSATPALATGDAAAGEKVFKKCKACHVVDAEKHKTGPHLVNIRVGPLVVLAGIKNIQRR